MVAEWSDRQYPLRIQSGLSSGSLAPVLNRERDSMTPGPPLGSRLWLVVLRGAY